MRTLVLRDVRLLDVSIVDRPANPECTIAPSFTTRSALVLWRCLSCLQLNDGNTKQCASCGGKRT